MKKIGIVGGLSPESTILYYKTIVNEYRRRFQREDYPVIIVYSLSFGLFKEHVSRGNHSGAVGMLIEAVESLYRAGADFALISANTPHMFYEEVRAKSPIPLLNIIDCLAEEARRDGVTRIGLLGTKYTLTKGFYAERLRRHGMEAIIPDREDIELVNNVIFNELTWGIIREESKRKIIEVIKRLKEKGAQAIALACTELPLLFKDTEEVVGLKLYDTARIHATKALEHALGKNTCSSPRVLTP